MPIWVVRLMKYTSEWKKAIVTLTEDSKGIAFFESWTGDGDKTFSAMITRKNSDGTYKYVKPLINILMFFGADGINYNWEDNSWSNSDIVAFHKALWKEAANAVKKKAPRSTL